jgi:hypothetical protein
MSLEGNRFEPAAATNLLALFAFQDWAKIRELLGVLQKDMKAALRTATRQAGQWANREGARRLAKEANVPLRNLRRGLRLKFQYQSVKGFATARLWYGLNPIALKYLGARETAKGVRVTGEKTIKGAFIVPTLGENVFKRVGKERLPIKRQERPIAEKGTAFLVQFEKEVTEKFVEFFFLALDKAAGRDAGESQAIAGGVRIAR